jgi:hypothetical protein
MKARSTLFTIFMLINMTAVKAQGSGKVFLKADIETNNHNKDVQVSVIDLITHKVFQKEEVSDQFFSAVPTQGRYMLYFKKVGHPSARMIIDTNVSTDDTYYVHFSLNLKNTSADLETGISVSAGTIKYDETQSGFVIEQPMASKAGLVTLTSSGTDAGLAKF